MKSDSILNIISKIENKLYKELPKDKHGYIRSIKKSYKELFDIKVKIDKYEEKRQFFIELHCLIVPIRLTDHEIYHEVSESLINEMRNFFSKAKILLNDFTVLIDVLIPETKRRGLRTKSFGSLVKSASKIGFKDKSIERLRVLISTLGLEIDNSILFYRDKYIEHSKTLDRGYLLSLDGKSQIAHNKNICFVASDVGQIDKMDKNLIFVEDVVKLSIEPDEEILYFHIDSKLNIGQSVTKDSQIGKMHDSSKVHFHEFGVHSHMFTSRGIKIEKPFKVVGHNKDDTTFSPKVDYSIQKVSEFIKKGFMILSDVI